MARTAPVVEEHHAEDVVLGRVDVDGVAERVARADNKGHLELKVQQAARAENRRLVWVGTPPPHGNYN